MKYLELFSIVCFLIAGAASNDYIGVAILLVALAGICAVLAVELPRRHKRKRVHRK